MKKGDFAINSRSDRRGSCGISEYTGSVSLINTVLKPSKAMNARYYNWLFHSSKFSDEFYRWGHGIVNDLWTTGWQEMKKISIPYPFLEEQQKIANFLDQKCSEIDSLTADITSQIEILKEYKKSLITEVVTKGLDPNVEMKDSGGEWIGEIPASWKVNKIKYISNSIFKGQGIKKEEVEINGDIQCVRYGEIYSKYSNSFNQCFSFVNSNRLSCKQPFIQNGDIIFAITGELIEEIGKNILYTGELACAVGSDIVAIRIDEDSRFVNYALNSSYCQKQKSCNKFKLKVVHISAFEIGNILVLIPPLSIQKSIADFLDQKCSEIDKTISEKQQQLEVLSEYKKSLIYEYVTGKKEVV